MARGFEQDGEVGEEILTTRGLVFIRRRAAHCNYTGAPGGSHLKDTWHACNLSGVDLCSYARLDCRVVVPASPVFRQRIRH